MESTTKNTLTFTQQLNESSIPFPVEKKEQARQIIESTPLPTTRTEAWKYTRVAKIGKIDFQNQVFPVDNRASYLIDPNAFTLVFVNGHFNADLSDQDAPEGCTYRLLSDQPSTAIIESQLPLEGELFHALNTAYLNDGVSLHVLPNAILERPIQILHILKGDRSISNFRVKIEAGSSSQASIVQGFFAEEGTDNFCNAITEVNVGQNAQLSIDKIQYESLGSYHIATEQVNQEKDSTYTINTVTLNGGLVRNNLNIDVSGQNCTTNLNGIYLLKDKQHVDNHTMVNHKVANCNSNELYKGVIDDDSTAVFNGKVFVRKDAQKINAFQSNGNVLLGDRSTINSKPELEIYADDVKCSHGSTTGQLDEEAVFYLRARGISEKSARKLMTAAFIGEVLEKIENKNVLTYIEVLLGKRFGWEF